MKQPALPESEDLYRTLFVNSHSPMLVIDPESAGIVDANPAACSFYGYRREELTARRITELNLLTEEEAFKEIARARAGEIQRFEFQHRLADGSVREVEVHSNPIRVQGRELLFLVIHDVTERTAQLQREIGDRRLAEGALRQSEQEYRELVENANSIILRMDAEGRITFVNEFAQRFFGYAEKELLGRHVVGTIVPETDRNGRDLQQMIQDLARHPERYARNENENMRANGERVWIAWTNKPLFDAAGRLSGCLCIGNDITELKRVEEELLRARDAAEAADRIKSAFLATVSHELRTPLNSIIGFTGILLQGLAGSLNEEQQKQLGMVQRSSRHLLQLINDVLDISKIEAGQIDLAWNPFDLGKSIAKAVQLVSPLAEEKGLGLRLDVSEEVGEIVSDQRRLEQIVINLLNNAVKFTDEGHIQVTCRVRDGQVLLTVRDTGIGMLPEDVETIFRPFHQIDRGLARKHEGTGLGLSICRKLLELMGGSIQVESEWGTGSTFTVRLPQRKGNQ